MNKRSLLSVTLPIVDIFIVGLRFLTWRLQNTKRGVDDWLILSGLIWLMGMGICLIDAHNGAFGSPTPAAPSDLSPEEEEELYTDPSTTFGQKQSGKTGGSTTAQLKYCALGFTSAYGLAISDFLVDIYVLLVPLPILLAGLTKDAVIDPNQVLTVGLW
ncbi:hypothetical protein EAE96_003226 [Botrytis aclada]|nr:hypothetical protein EAE96_003226 [Botrytis aclada]